METYAMLCYNRSAIKRFEIHRVVAVAFFRKCSLDINSKFEPGI